MTHPWPIRSPAQIARLTALAITRGLTACGERQPVDGAGTELFRHQQVFYVTKGDYALSLTDFKGTVDSRGDENGGRVALLRAAASRLP